MSTAARRTSIISCWQRDWRHVAYLSALCLSFLCMKVRTIITLTSVRIQREDPCKAFNGVQLLVSATEGLAGATSQ